MASQIFKIGSKLNVSSDLIGGKAASLNTLKYKGIDVPNGLCLTTEAFEKAIHNTLEDGGGNIELSSTLLAELEIELHSLLGKNLPKLAVRSSANVEDSNESAFAGMFESYLNISTISALKSAIEKCWSSPMSARVREYIQSRKLKLEDIKMGVIVQEMINPEFAGVGFTIDPLTGIDEVIYLEGVSGLAESLVSGETNPDFKIWVRKEEKRILKVNYDPSFGGIEVSPQFLDKIISSFSRIENLYGSAQDIEWVYSKGQLIIVQARPITRINKNNDIIVFDWELPESPLNGWGQKEHLLFDFWDEYNPRSISPLYWELLHRFFWQVNIEMFGVDIEEMSGDSICVLKDYVPIALDPCGNQNSAINLPKLNFELKINDWDKEFIEWKKQSIALKARVEKMSQLDVFESIELLREASYAICFAKCRRMSNMNQWIEGINNAKEKITNILSGYLQNVEEETFFEVLEYGIEHETAQMNKFLDILRNNKNKHEVKNEDLIESFLSRFGHFTLGDQTISSSFELFYDSLDADQKDPDSKSKIGKDRYNKLIKHLNKILSRDEWSSLKIEIEAFRDWIKIRESSKTLQNLSLPLLEQIIASLGTYCMERKLLEDASDITLFTLEEIARIPSSIERDKIKFRKKLIMWKEQRSWLPLGFDGKEVNKNEDKFIGEPGSPGKVTSNVVVIKELSEFNKVNQGDILVTYQTNPAWTPLFNKIDGIVIENGSRLSHAAITAREYGIPCVLGIKGISKALVNGEKIKLDGDLGLISRINE